RTIASVLRNPPEEPRSFCKVSRRLVIVGAASASSAISWILTYSARVSSKSLPANPTKAKSGSKHAVAIRAGMLKLASRGIMVCSLDCNTPQMEAIPRTTLLELLPVGVLADRQRRLGAAAGGTPRDGCGRGVRLGRAGAPGRRCRLLRHAGRGDIVEAEDADLLVHAPRLLLQRLGRRRVLLD